MDTSLPPGLYEALVTQALREKLDALGGALDAAEGDLDPDAAADILAQHLRILTAKTLRSLRGKDRVARQVDLANALIQRLSEAEGETGMTPADAVDPPARQLLHLVDPASARLGTGGPPARPYIPLRSSDLLVNGPRDHQIGPAIRTELASADRVDLLLAFLKWSGVRILLDPIRAFLARRPGQLRILTTTYLGATDPEALAALAELGAEIRVSYDQRNTRLHAKAWLFHRESGFSTAYVGSSNLSAPAMLDGLEWNVRLTEVDNRPLLAKFRATFEQYWGEGAFQPYDREIFAEAVRPVGGDAALIAAIEVRPYPFQREILDALSVERERGHTRNLVVAATGTGKTIVAALDFKRLRAREGDRSLLFVAHRQEILEQARHMFRVVLQDGAFGELLVGGHRPIEGRHVFAAVQSLHADRLSLLAPDAYDVVIVDEFHHAAAPTYDRLLGHLSPTYLLGLTATPERADGQSILPHFEGRVAFELRLWEALERGLLCPFQYFGIADGTDLRDLAWRRGYVPSELENLYTGDDLRAKLILKATQARVGDLRRMRALGFCVSIAHATFMAERFTRWGVPAEAIHSQLSADARRDLLRRFKAGQIPLLFAIDLFNEGVDVPEIDTVLFLRPTQSPTVFLQQLGRGLRRHEGKPCLTVLDFIGDAHRSFRFDLSFKALLGGTRRRLLEEVEAGFPRLPPGCAMVLDAQAQKAVLENLKGALNAGWRGLLEDLSALGDVPLEAFLEKAGVELEDLYRGEYGFTALRRRAGFSLPPAGPGERMLQRAFGRLLHVDDPDRLDGWRALLASNTPPLAEDANTREGRLQGMLFATLGHLERPLTQMGAALAELWEEPAALAELRALLNLLSDRLRHPTFPLEPTGAAPLRVHARYALDEIVAALHITRSGKLFRPRGQGVFYHREGQTDCLFITLEKSERDYSPTTLYDDYPLSPTHFHWESQNSTAPHTEVGMRYLSGESRVLLFARERRHDGRATVPYTLLGPAHLEHHEGERPMRIVWRLERAMPEGWYQRVKIAAG